MANIRDILSLITGVGGGAIGFSAGGFPGAAVGFGLGSEVGNTLFGQQEELPLATRPDIGAASAQAAKDQAAYFQSVLNQNLQSNILPGITREWGMAGRLRGGRFPNALAQAGTDTQRLIANAIQQGAMQRFGITTNAEIALRQQEEDRAFRQAQFDISGQTDYTDIGFKLAQLYFMQGQGNDKSNLSSIFGSLNPSTIPTSF